MDKSVNKKQKWDLTLAIAAPLLILLAWLLHYFRTPLLGITKGYEPHNFWFNTNIFLPIIILSIFFACLVNLRIICYGSQRPDKKKKIIALLLTLPIIILALGSIVFIIIAYSMLLF